MNIQQQESIFLNFTLHLIRQSFSFDKLLDKTYNYKINFLKRYCTFVYFQFLCESKKFLLLRKGQTRLKTITSYIFINIRYINEKMSFYFIKFIFVLKPLKKYNKKLLKRSQHTFKKHDIFV